MNPKISLPEKVNRAFIPISYVFTSEGANKENASLVCEDQECKAGYLQVKKVMVADDDSATVDVVTLMLENAGYKVFATGNMQTIADATRVCPDVILLDIFMSGVNGHDICKKLKSQQATKHIPIIIISANIHANEIALLASADDFIIKPFEMRNLLQKVAMYV